MNRGFVYLVAIMDWYSRYVLSWELSNSLDASFCLTALSRALSQARPEIFNSDQGTQFTCDGFTSRLKQADIAISWTGKGRCFDNIFVERLWRTVKYEEVYLYEYHSVPYSWQRPDSYFTYYNTERKHSSLGKKHPNRFTYQRVNNKLRVCESFCGNWICAKTQMMTSSPQNPR